MFPFNVGQTFSLCMFNDQGRVFFFICKDTLYSLVQRQRKDDMSVSHVPEWFLTYRDCFMNKDCLWVFSPLYYQQVIPHFILR